jgi:hypothetical protein
VNILDNVKCKVEVDICASYSMNVVHLNLVGNVTSLAKYKLVCIILAFIRQFVRCPQTNK